MKPNMIPASGMLTGRATVEWVGKTPDSVPPPHVVARIFLRHFRRCHLSGVEIRPGMNWHVEHIIPLWKGGENRESNMAPALVGMHKIKTAEEAGERAMERKKRQKAFGIKKAKRPMPGSRLSPWRRKMNGRLEKRT